MLHEAGVGARRVGAISVGFGVAAICLRITFLLVTPVGFGQFGGLIVAIPAIIFGVIGLTMPGSHRVVIAGLVVGLLVASTAIGFGAAA